MCVLLSLMVETTARSDAVAQLTAMSSSQNETIVQNVLKMMCDAVDSCSVGPIRMISAGLPSQIF